MHTHMTEISGRDGGNRASFQSGDVEGGESLHGCRNLSQKSRADPLNARESEQHQSNHIFQLNPLPPSSYKTANPETQTDLEIAKHN